MICTGKKDIKSNYILSCVPLPLKLIICRSIASFVRTAHQAFVHKLEDGDLTGGASLGCEKENSAVDQGQSQSQGQCRGATARGGCVQELVANCARSSKQDVISEPR